MATRRSEQWVNSSHDTGGLAEQKRSGFGKTPRSLTTRAVELLSRRDYSRAELGKKLSQPTMLQLGKQIKDGLAFVPPSADEIESVLDKMSGMGYLNNVRFTASLVQKQAKRHGSARVLMALAPHALDSGEIEKIASELKITELARCYHIWAQRYAGSHSDATQDEATSFADQQKYRAKQMRFLMGRGFNSDAIRKVMGGWRPTD